jgi:anti-anti-sigma factor
MNAPTVAHETIDGRPVARIAGALDFTSARRVGDDLDDLLRRTSAELILDLSATTFLDSAGINLLYDIHAALRSRGGQLHLIVPPENLIRRTLELTSAERSFLVHATMAEAARATARR